MIKLPLKNRLAIFDRAYDKAAKLKPGEEHNLAPLELEILLDAIEKYHIKWSEERRKFRKKLLY